MLYLKIQFLFFSRFCFGLGSSLSFRQLSTRHLMTVIIMLYFYCRMCVSWCGRVCVCAKVCLGVWQPSTADRKILIPPLNAQLLNCSSAQRRSKSICGTFTAVLWATVHFSPWHWPGLSRLYVSGLLHHPPTTCPTESVWHSVRPSVCLSVPHGKCRKTLSEWWASVVR